ncbi:MAG: ABC transporter permease, partial [Gemmatimonadales bacterium]
GIAIVGLFTVAAILAPIFAPYDPVAQLDLERGQLLPPSLAHPFGTDFLSRDLLSRVLYGARVSLAVAFFAVVISVTLGGLLGMIAGLAGRWIDSLLMRLVDVGLAVPRVFLLLVVLALWGNVGLATLVLVLGLTSWFDTSRLVRAEVLSLRKRDFMTAARAAGVPRPRLLVRHVLPNVAAPIIVTATLGMGQIILIEAGLSFLGIGVPRPTPSWGAMIADGQREGLLTAAPWIAGFPGAAIVITVLAFSLLGDALRDVIDPRSR